MDEPIASICTAACCRKRTKLDLLLTSHTPIVTIDLTMGVRVDPCIAPLCKPQGTEAQQDAYSVSPICPLITIASKGQKVASSRLDKPRASMTGFTGDYPAASS